MIQSVFSLNKLQIAESDWLWCAVVWCAVLQGQLGIGSIKKNRGTDGTCVQAAAAAAPQNLLLLLHLHLASHLILTER